MINNYTPELKSQETSYGRNKMGHLNLLPDQYVHAMFPYRTSEEMFQKTFVNSASI